MRIHRAEGSEAQIKFILRLLFSPFWVPVYAVYKAFAISVNFIGTLAMWLFTGYSWSYCWRKL